jgi:GT2 family glycosyltransferase
VSAIIPNRDSPRIAEVIAALIDQRTRVQVYEIIVVGKDCHNLIIPNDLVRFIETSKPISAAAARNRGAAVAKGDVLLFVDADCILASSAVERLLEAIEQDYDVVVGGIVPERENYWVLASNLLMFAPYLVFRCRGDRHWLPSFCMAMSHAVWQAIGPFDERFNGAGGEDTDLSVRLRQAGYRLGCEPAAYVYHRPMRTNLKLAWNHATHYGNVWTLVYRCYRDVLPLSKSIWLAEHLGSLAAITIVPFACVYVFQLMLSHFRLLRFWYAIPGMLWIQTGFYTGVHEAASRYASTD